MKIGYSPSNLFENKDKSYDIIYYLNHSSKLLCKVERYFCSSSSEVFCSGSCNLESISSSFPWGNIEPLLAIKFVFSPILFAIFSYSNSSGKFNLFFNHNPSL